MDTDRPSQEGRENVPREFRFISAPREADPMPVVTRSSEGTRPEPTSAMVTRSRAREGREQEIATCEEGLGAARPFPTDTGSLFTFAEIVTAHTSQEVTETTFPPHDNPIPPPHKCTGQLNSSTNIRIVSPTGINR